MTDSERQAPVYWPVYLQRDMDEEGCGILFWAWLLTDREVWE